MRSCAALSRDLRTVDDSDSEDTSSDSEVLLSRRDTREFEDSRRGTTRSLIAGSESDDNSLVEPSNSNWCLREFKEFVLETFGFETKREEEQTQEKKKAAKHSVGGSVDQESCTDEGENESETYECKRCNEGVMKWGCHDQKQGDIGVWKCSNFEQCKSSGATGLPRWACLTCLTSSAHDFCGECEPETQEKQEKPRCPKARCRILMTWGKYDKGEYAKGWECDNVATNTCKGQKPGHRDPGESRWFCERCCGRRISHCDDCHKKKIQKYEDGGGGRFRYHVIKAGKVMWWIIMLTMVLAVSYVCTFHVGDSSGAPESCGPWFSMFFHGWLAQLIWPSAGLECLNGCGLVKNFSDSVATLPVWHPVNRTIVELTDIVSCSRIVKTDEVGSDTDDGLECQKFCDAAIGYTYFSPLCFIMYQTPRVCLKARVANYFQRYPWFGGLLIALSYTAISLVLAFLTRGVRAKRIDWRWQDEVPFDFPMSVWKRKEKGPEQEKAMFLLRKTALLMATDRLSDVTAIWQYLVSGQPFFAAVTVFTIVAFGDPWQIRGAHGIRAAVHAGGVQLEQLHQKKAEEGLMEGSYGFLVPITSIFSSTLDWTSACILLFAAATSFLTVADGYAGSQELNGALNSCPLMPFAEQNDIAKTPIKILRGLELAALIPVVAMVAGGGLVQAYYLNVVILLPIYVYHFLNDQQTFHKLNARLGGKCVRGFFAVLCLVILSPLQILWPGCWYEQVAYCSRRDTFYQQCFPVVKPGGFYAARGLLGCVASIFVVRSIISVKSDHFTDYTFHQRDLLTLPTCVISRRLFSTQWFLQVHLLMAGIVASLSVWLLWRYVSKLDEKEKPVAETKLVLLELELERIDRHLEAREKYRGEGIHQWTTRMNEYPKKAYRNTEVAHNEKLDEVVIAMHKLGDAYNENRNGRRAMVLLERALREQRESYKRSQEVEDVGATMMREAVTKFAEQFSKAHMNEKFLVLKEEEKKPSLKKTWEDWRHHYQNVQKRDKLGCQYSRIVLFVEILRGLSSSFQQLASKGKKLSVASEGKKLSNELGIALDPSKYDQEALRQAAGIATSLAAAYHIVGLESKAKMFNIKALLNQIMGNVDPHFIAPNLIQLGDTLESWPELAKALNTAAWEIQVARLAELNDETWEDSTDETWEDSTREEKVKVAELGIAFAKEGLSWACGLLGDRKSKKEYAKSALETIEKEYGPSHLRTSVTLIHVGAAYGVLGNYPKAAANLERSLKIRERRYGPQHREVVDVMELLADTYVHMGMAGTKEHRGKIKDAMSLINRAYRINQAEYTIEFEGYSRRARTLRIKSKVHGEQSELAKGRASVMMAKLKKKLGDAKAKQVEADVDSKVKELQTYAQKKEEIIRVDPMIHDLLAILPDELQTKDHDCEDEDHDSEDENDKVQLAKCLKGFVSAKAERLVNLLKAKRDLKEAYNILCENDRDDEREIALTQSMLGEACMALGQTEDARNHLKAALGAMKTTYCLADGSPDEDHPCLADGYLSYGRLHHGHDGIQEDKQKARTFIGKACLIFEKNFGEAHPKTRRAKNYYFEVCGREEAIPLTLDADRMIMIVLKARPKECLWERKRSSTQNI